ncbi:MAG: DUF3179 domain-containing protein [Anaerolineales bacterium]|nr:DUF3179 domain-containing protein [Anaerolineales bacterium]
MPETAGAKARTRTSKQKVPSYLIKEWVYNTPVYYKGYRDVLQKKKTTEDILADGTLQAAIKFWLTLLLGNHLDLAKYWVFSGEVGSHVAPKKNAAHDLVIIEKRLLPPGNVSNRYADVPARVVIEIDTAIEYGNDRPIEQFVQQKTQQTLDFGTTGRLHYSNLIMYDRQTETWWQQATGEAIVGELTGTRLTFLPAPILSWADFKATYPEGKVLSRETGFNRAYGRNPYAGYDNVNNPPFLYDGPTTPDVLPPVARVLTVDLNGEAKAYPYDVLQEAGVVNDTVGGQDLVVFWSPGTASALDDGTVAGGRDVGTANAFARAVDGQFLTFTFDGTTISDVETGSVWTARGEAVSGPLAGEQLSPVVAVNHFWFSWAAFKPETQVYPP